jgi:hypothetical protein
VTKALPANRKPHFVASPKGEALVTACLALPPLIYAIYEKTQASDATAPAKRLLETLAKAKPQEMSDAISKLDGVASGVTPAVLTVICFVLFAGYRYWGAHHREKLQDKTSGPDQLMGPLLMLYEAITRRKQLDVAHEEHVKKFRCTLHRVEKDEHEQHLPYVGFGADDPDRQPGPDRRWSNHCGLVGEVIRTGGSSPVLSQMLPTVKTSEDYAQALIKQHGYDRKQAKAHEPMRLSSLAIPINDGKAANVIAVLYCDSSEPDFFDPETQELCVFAAEALAKYIKLMA